VSLKTLAGMRALTRLLRASVQARAALARVAPSVVMSTGGYAAAPVVRAARQLGIPYVLFDSDAVPGRSNAMFARDAFAVAVMFEAAKESLAEANVVRTGLPIRKALRDAASDATGGDTVLVTGGSQGSAFLNEALPRAAALSDLVGVEFLHVAGRGHAEEVRTTAGDLGLGVRYRVEEFLGADAMAAAYRGAAVAVARSGGSIAELALFRIPSVLVPLPASSRDHQTANAREFERMGAATLLPQAEASAERLGAAILGWMQNPDRTRAAREALAKFDAPDATERILELIEKAAR